MKNRLDPKLRVETEFRRSYFKHYDIRFLWRDFNV